MRGLIYCTRSNPDISINGFVVAEFELSLIEAIEFDNEKNRYEFYNIRQSCLSQNELIEYSKTKTIYGIHLNGLSFFKEPRTLAHYNIKRAPQNMCYVRLSNGEIAVLISVQPKWVELMKSGRKTIECRKCILNAMMEFVKQPFEPVEPEKFDVYCDALLFADGKIYPSFGKNHDWNIIKIAEKHYPILFKEILKKTECSSYKEIEENYLGQLVMGHTFSNRNKIMRYCAKYDIWNCNDFSVTKEQYATLKMLAKHKYMSELEIESIKLEVE